MTKDHNESKNKTKLYECGTCGRKLTYRNLKFYELNHQSMPKTIKCNNCEKCFDTQSSLRKHEIFHNDERKHKCDTCGKSFKTTANLNKHKKYHADDKQFECFSCGKRFIEKGTMKRHEMVHAKVKPFSCDTCEKSYNTNSSLKIHLAIHNGEDYASSYKNQRIKESLLSKKSLECKICKKTFPLK